MAGRNDRDRGDDAEDQEKMILIYTKQVYLHLLVGLLISLVSIGCFVGGVLFLRWSLQNTDELLAIKPENRAQSLSKAIERTQQKVAADYQSYTSKMDDPTLTEISTKFTVLHQLSLEAEDDYGRMLSKYQDASYQLASRIRGSGEWYFYYEREIDAYINVHRQLDKQLNQYLSSLEKK